MSVFNGLFGEVRFFMSGVGSEKLLSKAMQNGIILHNVRHDGGKIYATVRAGSYLKLRTPAKKLGVKIRTVKKSGLPFFIRKHRKRYGFVIGLVMFFALIHFMSLFVWEIEIEGKTEVPLPKILQAAAETGISEGVFLPNLNLRRATVELTQALPELSWIAVNSSGSKVIIKLHDRVIAPEIIAYDEPCNIKASKNGVIVRVETERGEKVVSEGQTVLKGDLLVSGVWETDTGEIFLYHARARVYAKTSYEEVIEIPFNAVEHIPTGNTVERKHVICFGIELPINLQKAPESGEWKREFSSERISFLGAELPVLVYREIWHELKAEERILTEEDAVEMADAELQKRIDENYKDREIKGIEKNYEITDRALVLRVTVSCEENIAEETRIHIENEKTV